MFQKPPYKITLLFIQKQTCSVIILAVTCEPNLEEMEIREITQQQYEAARSFHFTVTFNETKQTALLNEFADIIGPLEVGDLRDLFEEFWGLQIQLWFSDNFEYLFSDYRGGELIDKIKDNWRFESKGTANHWNKYFEFIEFNSDDERDKQFISMFIICQTLWEYLAQDGLITKTIPCHLLDPRIWGLDEGEIILIVQRLTGFLMLWSFIYWTVEISEKR